MKTDDGNLYIVAGASRCGKTTKVARAVKGARRIMAWDPEAQWCELRGWVKVTTKAQLLEYAQKPGPYKVAYVAGGDLKADVHELYQVHVTDPDAFPIVGEQLDLAEMVREAVLLEAPTNPLCRPDCAGLCPVCGVDRNEAACSCDTTVRDERWAALDALKPDSR